jgi:surface polysaccharide O-acyltransferase-like enzyme
MGSLFIYLYITMQTAPTTAVPRPRVFFAEILRALAIFAVIILHNSADYGEQYGQIPMSHWWSGTIWDGLVRFCVPMFVMLSGAFLLKPEKEVSIKEVFVKRLPKILIPLVFWSIVYVLYAAYNSEERIGGINVKEQLKTFIEGPVIYHFWFLYMMIGIYLLYPIINLFITSAKKVHIEYFLIVWFFANSIFGTIETLFDLSIGIDLSFFIGYAGYFVLGYYLYTYTFTKRQLNIAYLLGLFGFLLSTLFPYICIVLNFKERASLIESDFTIDIVLVEIALFLWFKNRTYNEESTSFGKKAISEISKESFGIYLVHVLLMEMLFEGDLAVFPKFAETVSTWHPAWAIPVKALLILVLSYGVIKLIRQVPFLRKVAG